MIQVKLTVNGEVMHVVGEGDGPVNALDAALRKALLPVYPSLAEMHLVDYKVRVINSAEGTAARVRVVIESRDEDDVWSTVGVSENIIEASWLALVDSDGNTYSPIGFLHTRGDGLLVKLKPGSVEATMRERTSKVPFGKQ